MNTKFAPAINLDGENYTPKGYMWILGFAFAGRPWAVKQATTQEFKNIIRKDLRKTQNENLKKQIMYYQEKIEQLQGELVV
jgi:hypothetical protein